jgi:hypothetical protein
VATHAATGASVSTPSVDEGEAFRSGASSLHGAASRQEVVAIGVGPSAGSAWDHHAQVVLVQGMTHTWSFCFWLGVCGLECETQGVCQGVTVPKLPRVWVTLVRLSWSSSVQQQSRGGVCVLEVCMRQVLTKTRAWRVTLRFKITCRCLAMHACMSTSEFQHAHVHQQWKALGIVLCVQCWCLRLVIAFGEERRSLTGWASVPLEPPTLWGPRVVRIQLWQG